MQKIKGDFKKVKNNKGITLVALVITIILLLILAGVTIATLGGENGLITRAKQAKQNTLDAQEKEKLQLSIQESIIATEGKNITNPAGAMPSGATVIETDASKGIVIKDSNQNEWVWIEVPKDTVFTSVSSETDYDNIKENLIAYATDYREGKTGQGCNWTDEWYDKYGTTYDGINDYSQIKYITTATSGEFSQIKEYYGTIYTNIELTTPADSYVEGTKYYAKRTDEQKNKTDGCGLTYEKYNENYNKMLSSVYKNGGFWISRYEIGKEGETAVSKQNMTPYVSVTCSKAQEKANVMVTEGKTSSLMYGIQWDLVCKYIESKEQKTKDGTNTLIDKTLIKSDSSSWGNYSNVSFEYKGGTKSEGSQRLSTGVAERNSVLNIYDFAGNVWECTLEHTSNSSVPCASRGGGYNYRGSSLPASYRGFSSTSLSGSDLGFRATLY